MLVYKEQLLDCTGVLPIELPYENVKEAKENILHLEVQFDNPCMWFNVLEKDKKEFLIVSIGTGHNWGDTLHRDEYLGSLVSGMYVWHYFIVEEEEFKNRIECE